MPLYLDAGSINDGSDGAVTVHREGSPLEEEAGKNREVYMYERRGGREIANHSEMRGMNKKIRRPCGDEHEENPASGGGTRRVNEGADKGQRKEGAGVKAGV